MYQLQQQEAVLFLLAPEQQPRRQSIAVLLRDVLQTYIIHRFNSRNTEINHQMERELSEVLVEHQAEVLMHRQHVPLLHNAQLQVILQHHRRE